MEHIVVDGLSSDKTLQVIEDHAQQIDYYVSEPDGGLYDALNKAVALAQGSLICVLNGDDWLTPDAAAVAAKALLAQESDAVNPGPLLITTAAWAEHSEKRRLWLPGLIDDAGWLVCPNVCHNGVYATPAAYRVTGGYETGLRVVADTRWLLAAWDAKVPIVRVRHPTVHYRMGGLSSDTRLHVLDFHAMLRLRFPSLSETEAWALLLAFYSHRVNLKPFEHHCPAHLGQALGQVFERHRDDSVLTRALLGAGLERQLPAMRPVSHPSLPHWRRWHDSATKRYFEFRLAWLMRQPKARPQATP